MTGPDSGGEALWDLANRLKAEESRERRAAAQARWSSIPAPTVPDDAGLREALDLANRVATDLLRARDAALAEREEAVRKVAAVRELKSTWAAADFVSHGYARELSRALGDTRTDGGGDDA